MYSSIFSFSSLTESDGDRSSTTKSGQMWGKDSLSSSDNLFHRSSFTHDISGERLAPLGRTNNAFDSKPTPVPSFSAQTPKRTMSETLCFDVSPPVGGIKIMSPSFDISTRRSGFWRHISKKSSSVKSLRSASILIAKSSLNSGVMSVVIIDHLFDYHH